MIPLSPSPYGERVGVRGGNKKIVRGGDKFGRKRLPLTLTLSPLKKWREGIFNSSGKPRLYRFECVAGLGAVGAARLGHVRPPATAFAA